MPGPTVHPDVREQVPPADGYHRGDRVWVYEHGGWQPGVVEGSSARGVMVTYRLVGRLGRMVDTVTAVYVMGRSEFDPQLDIHGAGS